MKLLRKIVLGTLTVIFKAIYYCIAIPLVIIVAFAQSDLGKKSRLRMENSFSRHPDLWYYNPYQQVWVNKINGRTSPVPPELIKF